MSPDISQLQHIITSNVRVQPHGARTKITTSNGAMPLDLTAFSGVIEYQPSEFIITAWAGTPVRNVVALLAERGQYLPFDPLLVERGATLGGAIATNACGPERYRYGGARDFLIGTHFIDGNGELLHGGGKVVKNAAGFDYPKLMVGSLGALGALVDVTFKVFPAPEAYATLVVDCASLHEALTLLPKLTNCPYDINAMDVVVKTDKHPEQSSSEQRERWTESNGASLHVRIGGLRDALRQRLDRVRTLCGKGEIVEGEADLMLWREARELTWASPHAAVVKLPLTPARIPALDEAIQDSQRRYSVGGNVAWIATTDTAALDVVLKAQGLSGLVLIGANGDPRIGKREANAFAERVKRAMDPQGKFG
jgi:glycolate oxidase FAD binding subunit